MISVCEMTDSMMDKEPSANENSVQRAWSQSVILRGPSDVYTTDHGDGQAKFPSHSASPKGRGAYHVHREKMAKEGRGRVCALDGTKRMRGPEAAQRSRSQRPALLWQSLCLQRGEHRPRPVKDRQGSLHFSPTLPLEKLRHHQQQHTETFPRKHQDKKASIRFLILPQTPRRV